MHGLFAGVIIWSHPQSKMTFHMVRDVSVVITWGFYYVWSTNFTHIYVYSFILLTLINDFDHHSLFTKEKISLTVFIHNHWLILYSNFSHIQYIAYYTCNNITSLTNSANHQVVFVISGLWLAELFKWRHHLGAVSVVSCLRLGRFFSLLIQIILLSLRNQ